MNEPPDLPPKSPPPFPAGNQPVPVPKMGESAGARMLLPVGRSGWAIAAGYLGLFSLLIVFAPFSLVISIIAIRDIKKSRREGRPLFGMGRAIFGLVLGILGTALLLFGLSGLFMGPLFQ